jgi:hypothetical protein
VQPDTGIAAFAGKSENDEAYVKKSLIGSLCLAFCFGWVSPGRAQQAQPPQTPPPQAQAPPQTSPSQDQTPPDQQDQQSKTNILQPPPLPPKAPDIRMPGETGWFVGLTGWFPTQEPDFNAGRASNPVTYPSNIRLLGTPKLAGGFEFGMAVGAHNTLRVSAFEASASGDFTPSVEISLPSQEYTAGTLVSTSYRVRNLKLSYEYLTWPYPVESRRFRLKTLWQVQFTDVNSAFDAPLKPLVDSSGNPILDSSGNPVDYSGRVDHWFVSPTFGLGATEYVSKHLRLELNASGFAIPRHTDIWDADASANFRIGHFELRVGAKAFHWKTSTNSDFYTRNTMAAAFAGIRVNLD